MFIFLTYFPFYLDGKTHIYPFVSEDPFGPVRDKNSYLEDFMESEHCIRDLRGE
jgi:hypothetical protein